MQKLTIITIITSIIYLIYQAITPDFVKINKLQVQYCTISTEQNPDIICD